MKSCTVARALTEVRGGSCIVIAGTSEPHGRMQLRSGQEGHRLSKRGDVRDLPRGDVLDPADHTFRRACARVAVGYASLSWSDDTVSGQRVRWNGGETTVRRQ